MSGAERQSEEPPLIDAVKQYATVGELVSVLKGVFGDFREPVGL